jgi:hypothetical protein
MKKILLTLVTGLFVVGCMEMTQPAFAQGRLNILIMGEDADIDTIPRGNRIFKRVLASLMNELHVGGNDVWDEVAVTGGLAQDRSRRSNEEIIAVARLVQRPPIDVAVIFSIYPSATQTQIATRVDVRIEGRLINMPDGRFLGNFEVDSPDNWTAPFNCDDDCLLESVGDHAKILASALGDVLTEMLDDQTRQGGGVVADGGGLVNTWTLVFDGFNDEDALLIEDYLVVFTGYDSHTPIYCIPRHCEISYKSTIEDARLVRNLDLMLARIGVSGRVFAAPGEITVAKVRSQERRVNAEGL